MFELSQRTELKGLIKLVLIVVNTARFYQKTRETVDTD